MPPIPRLHINTRMNRHPHYAPSSLYDQHYGCPALAVLLALTGFSVQSATVGGVLELLLALAGAVGDEAEPETSTACTRLLRALLSAAAEPVLAT